MNGPTLDTALRAAGLTGDRLATARHAVNVLEIQHGVSHDTAARAITATAARGALWMEVVSNLRAEGFDIVAELGGHDHRPTAEDRIAAGQVDLDMTLTAILDGPQ